jgi:hypothetical protein
MPAEPSLRNILRKSLSRMRPLAAGNGPTCGGKFDVIVLLNPL